MNVAIEQQPDDAAANADQWAAGIAANDIVVSHEIERCRQIQAVLGVDPAIRQLKGSAAGRAFKKSWSIQETAAEST